MAESKLVDELNRALQSVPERREFPPPLTRKPGFQFTGDKLSLDSNAYVPHGSMLTFSTWSATAGVTINIAYKILLASGEMKGFSGSFVTTGSFSQDEHVEILPECIILSVLMETIGIQQRGECFVSIAVTGSFLTSGDNVWVLSQGYLTNTSPMTYPPAVRESGSNGRGYLRVINPGAQSAGSNLIYTTETDASHIIHSVFIAFATSATVANRTMTLSLYNGGAVYQRNRSQVPQTASVTWNYWFDGQSGRIVQVLQDIPVPTLFPVRVQPGDSIRTEIGSLQAGDQITGCKILLESLFC